MSIAPLLPTEQQRLAALHALQILDTPPEERFDRITRLATLFFDVPISLVTFVEEQRQWFKSVQGLSICETPRDQSFCAHALSVQGVLVVPDALLDPRFEYNPLVTGNPWIRFYAGAPIRALDGSPLGTLCIIDRQPRDLSPADQRALEDLAQWVEHEINTIQVSEALLQRENEVRLRAMMESTSEGMILLSPDERILFFNRCFSEFFNLPATLSPGQFYKTALAPHTVHIFEDDIQIQEIFPGLSSDRERQTTQYVHQVWPQKRDLELFSAPVQLADNTHLGRLYTFRDVTRERELERMKSGFVAHTSHELRTPLTVIQGYIELLEQGQLGPVSSMQQQALTVVDQTVKEFSRLVNDLLDFSRVDAGHLTLQKVEVDLLSILQHAVDSLSPRISKKQQTLTLLSPDQPLPAIKGDRGRLTQVFLNLLTNAHQYTPEGGQIWVKTAVEGGHVRIDVQDTGRGMSDEEQRHVFDTFYRAQPALEEPGSGLGLTIAKALVEMHEGFITVTSAPGQGSTFTVSLPYGK
jgi:signal transduction histidine kinase